MPEFYYNTVTKQVEEGRQSSVNQLMGPYSTREEALKAFEIAAERNEQWEAEDEAWEADDDNE